MSERGSLALIDFLYFSPSAEDGEDEEDDEMAPTPKRRKLQCM